jgi:hypothetical protein
MTASRPPARTAIVLAYVVMSAGALHRIRPDLRSELAAPGLAFQFAFPHRHIRAVSRRCVGRDDLLEDVCGPLATSQKRFEAGPSADREADGSIPRRLPNVRSFPASGLQSPHT